MWILLIPAVAIVAAWAYGASKVGTAPLPHDVTPPAPPVPGGAIPVPGVTPAAPATGLKVGDTVIADFANATDVAFVVTSLTSPDPNAIMVSRSGAAPIQMPKDAIKKVIPS